MESKTPRTDAEFKLEAFFDGSGIVETVFVEFARELETELAEARAEIERLNKGIKIVQSAFKNYKNADAIIARTTLKKAQILSASCNSDAVDSERAANEILTTEIERKDKLIEQMREALEALRKYPNTYIATGQGAGVAEKDLAMCDAALAAERGG